MSHPTQSLIERPPVVAVMGHIDHGKSTLLDYIRKTNIVAKEAGGITQHIAAYEVIHTKKGDADKRITFLDTPGHAAFKGIRIRGASVADIAILVVSAEEGVKPQTLEALECIKESHIPYLVAISKVDSPKANVEKIKQNLAEHEMYLEGYGGQISWVAISAKTGEGIPELLDMVLLTAEIADLKGNPALPAEGVLIEANLDTKKGIAATLIIKNGSLTKSMAVVCGETIAPVRILEDFKGKAITEATFSSPIRLIGFDQLPRIGENFQAYATKKEAEAAVAEARLKAGAKKAVQHSNNDDKMVIPVVLKADVSGTLEAIEGEMKKLDQSKVVFKIIHSGIGEITEKDVKVVVGQEKAVVIGFNVKFDPQAKSLAERLSLTVHSFDIIYKLVEWLDGQIKANTPKIMVDESTGKARIAKCFSKDKDKQVVGGRVLEGVIKSGSEVKIFRREAEIGRGKIRELQQQKIKSQEAKKDTEFGTLIDSKIEIAPGDVIECFITVEK